MRIFFFSSDAENVRQRFVVKDAQAAVFVQGSLVVVLKDQRGVIKTDGPDGRVQSAL